MPRAADFTPPDLTSTGILDKAQQDNHWSDADAAEAKEWYEHFLELKWASPGKPIYVMANKADRLWHTHITFTQPYQKYCDDVLGDFLHHTPTVPPHHPTPIQIADATRQYKKWGPIPDATTWCV